MKPDGSRALEWVSKRVTVGYPVFVAAPDSGEARIETVFCGHRAGDPCIFLWTEQAVDAAHKRLPWIMSRLALWWFTYEGVECGHIQVDVGDLPGGMHTGVGTTGHREHGQRSDPIEYGLKCPLDLALHGAQFWLPAPAVKVRAVVGDAEAHSHRRPPTLLCRHPESLRELGALPFAFVQGGCAKRAQNREVLGPFRRCV